MPRSSLQRVDGMPVHDGAFSIYGPNFHLRSTRINSMGTNGRHRHCPGSFYLQIKGESPIGAPYKTLFSGWTTIETVLERAFNLLSEQGHQVAMTLFVPNGEYQFTGYYVLHRDPVTKHMEAWFAPASDSIFSCPICTDFSRRQIHLVMEHLLSHHMQDLKDRRTFESPPPIRIPACDLPIHEMEQYLWLFFICNARS